MSFFLLDACVFCCTWPGIDGFLIVSVNEDYTSMGYVSNNSRGWLSGGKTQHLVIFPTSIFSCWPMRSWVAHVSSCTHFCVGQGDIFLWLYGIIHCAHAMDQGVGTQTVTAVLLCAGWIAVDWAMSVVPVNHTTISLAKDRVFFSLAQSPSFSLLGTYLYLSVSLPIFVLSCGSGLIPIMRRCSFLSKPYWQNLACAVAASKNMGFLAWLRKSLKQGGSSHIHPRGNSVTATVCTIHRERKTWEGVQSASGKYLAGFCSYAPWLEGEDRGRISTVCIRY